MSAYIIAFLYLFALALVSLFVLIVGCYFLNRAHGGTKNFFRYLIWYIKKF